MTENWNKFALINRQCFQVNHRNLYCQFPLLANSTIVTFTAKLHYFQIPNFSWNYNLTFKLQYLQIPRPEIYSQISLLVKSIKCKFTKSSRKRPQLAAKVCWDRKNTVFVIDVERKEEQKRSSVKQSAIRSKWNWTQRMTTTWACESALAVVHSLQCTVYRCAVAASARCCCCWSQMMTLTYAAGWEATRCREQNDVVVVVIIIMLRVSESELNRQRQDCHEHVLSSNELLHHGQYSHAANTIPLSPVFALTAHVPTSSSFSFSSYAIQRILYERHFLLKQFYLWKHLYMLYVVSIVALLCAKISLKINEGSTPNLHLILIIFQKASSTWIVSANTFEFALADIVSTVRTISLKS